METEPYGAPYTYIASDLNMDDMKDMRPAAIIRGSSFAIFEREERCENVAGMISEDV